MRSRRPVKRTKQDPKALVNVLGGVIRETPELTLATAVVHLKMIIHGRHLLDLHQKLFPADFKKHGFDLGSAQAAAESYNRFTRLVDQHLFPCWEFSEHYLEIFDWVDSGSIETRYDMIPIRHTSEVWIDRVPGEDFTAFEKLIVGATISHYEFDNGPPPLRLPKNHEFDFMLLRKICATQPGPLRNLCHAVESLAGATGNEWIDVDEDCFYQCELPAWKEQTVLWLAEDWKEASEIRKKAQRVHKWVGDDPRRLKQVEALLRRAMRPLPLRTRVGEVYERVVATRVGA